MSDEELWRRSRAGDRDAFGRIVERYQSLICSLAYSRCGNLAGSEDLAQETFVTAWRHIDELREPGKLRSWLCGIVRNLSATEVRRVERRGGPPGSLDSVAEHPSTEPDPAIQAVSQEEADLLWRALAGLPEVYRDPLVLFYREGQSVLQVSQALELSEDAVKQRLSRGRALLRDEMTALVESTLIRSKPTSDFKRAVLVALPVSLGASSTASAAISTQAGLKGAAGKGLLGKWSVGAFMGPVIGLGFAYLGFRAATATARTPQEREVVGRAARRIIGFCFLMSLGLAGILTQAGKWYQPSAAGIVGGVTLWVVALIAGILWGNRRCEKSLERIRSERAVAAEAATDFPRTTDDSDSQLAEGYFESQARFLGLPLIALAWGLPGPGRPRRRTVCAWVAAGDLAVSPLVAFGAVAIAPIAVGAVSVGIWSLSIVLGVAVGVLAVGSLAFGWWAFGFGAAGGKSAVGLAAVARDFAIGLVTNSTDAGPVAAKQWLQNQWWEEFAHAFIHYGPWWMLGGMLTVLGVRQLRLWGRSLRRE